MRSDYTDDGYILDRGFAVFIEEYPASKLLLDYDGLQLQQFLPGARVKLSDKEGLAAVSDPLIFFKMAIQLLNLNYVPLRDHLSSR